MKKEEKTVEAEKKAEALQYYEIVYLISNKYSEDEAESISKNISTLLEKNGAVIKNTENWGKRKLSYPIKHFYHAYYYIVECDLPKSSTQKIDNTLRLEEKILRHLIVQKRIKTDEEIAGEEKAAQRIAKEQAESAKTATEEVAKTKPKEKEEPKKAVNMEELDEKLEQILDDTKDLL